MSDSYLSIFLETHRAHSDSANINDSIAAVEVAASFPIELLEKQLREAVSQPSDWALQSAAVQAAFRTGGDWARSVVLDEYAGLEDARTVDGVHDAMRSVINEQRMRSNSDSAVESLQYLKLASQRADRAGQGAAAFLRWMGIEVD